MFADLFWYRMCSSADGEILKRPSSLLIPLLTRTSEVPDFYESKYCNRYIQS